MQLYGLFQNILKLKKMGIIKEPREVDLSTKSEPWTEQELSDFRKIMQGVKSKNAKRKQRMVSGNNKRQPVQ
jgi:hypothetical protein